MGRIRTIKPEFPQSETIGKLSRDSRLLFLQLFTIVDDCGRARGSSRMLASLLYPYDDDAPKLLQAWLDELSKNECIVQYEHEGARYVEIVNWLKHQKIDHPSQSRLPNPRESSRILAPYLGPSTLDLGPRINNHQESDWPSDYREIFWQTYPRKVGKKAAIEKLEKVKKSDAPPWASFLQAIQNIKATELRFIPHPVTWLNQGRWDDETGEVNGKHIQTTGNILASSEKLIGAIHAFGQPTKTSVTSGGESETVIRLLPKG
jgi:hypothetical protein